LGAGLVFRQEIDGAQSLGYATTMTTITRMESTVLAAIALNSKPFANGKGGLDAEEIARAVGHPIGSRVLVDILISLQLKQLLACVHTDEHEQRRKLYYLTKEVKVA
jgi:hypothetical protein